MFISTTRNSIKYKLRGAHMNQLWMCGRMFVVVTIFVLVVFSVMRRRKQHTLFD